MQPAFGWVSVSRGEALRQEMSQCLAVTPLSQDAQDAVAGLRDGVEVLPDGPVAGLRLNLGNVLIEQRQAGPEEGDDIDLVLGAEVNSQLFGRAAREDIQAQDRPGPKPGRGGPQPGQVVDPPQLGRGITFGRFRRGRAFREKQPGVAL
jgi:hypothetical protein